ncbi:hypothetical protein KKB68_00345, partial [Patescibacteria group bacterium]|nr:hypothetical protein [Patescibacteria group bacterium]
MENNNLHPQVPSTQEVEHDSQTSISQLPSEPTSLDDFSKKRKIIFSLVFIFIAASVAIVSFFAYNTFQESKKKAPSFDLNPTFVPENPEDKQVNDPVRQKETDQVLFYTDFTNLWRFNPNDLSRKKVTNQQIVWRHPLRVSPDGEKILATISFPTDKPPITTAILGV